MQTETYTRVNALKFKEMKPENNQSQTANQPFPDKATAQAPANQIMSSLCFRFFSIKTTPLAPVRGGLLPIQFGAVQFEWMHAQTLERFNVPRLIF